MMKAKNDKWFLILGFILTIVFMNLPVLYTYFYHDIAHTPKVINGSIDLSRVDIDDKKVYLDGQWEFYWNRFIVSEPDKFARPDLMLTVPEEWSNYKINGKNLTAGGCGSYRITITGVKYDKNVSLYIPEYGGAYRAFIDGHLVAESGIVSKYMDKIFTVPKASLYPLELSAGTNHEVVIEVATTRFSGLYITPILNNYYETNRENSLRDAIWFILFGIVLFSFIALIAIYMVFVRRKLHFIWMPVIITLILLRIMLTSEFYSLWQPVLFLNMSYESTNELMYFTTFALKYTLIFLVQEQCGITFSRVGKMGFLFYYVFLYLIYLLVPQNIYNEYLSVYVPMLSYVLDIYMFVKIFLGRYELKKYGIAVFWCVVLIIVGLAIDSYYINGKIYMNMSMNLLLMFMVSAIIMVCIYVMRSLDLYDDFAISSSKLDLANSQIAMQKEYYNTLREQIDEIREIKHDIRHFIGSMSRLANEGELNKLKIFLSEYGQKVDKEQLPIFCENVVANSIIGYYYIRAKESGIIFESQCNIKSNITMGDSDICIVLGNALENAIDACKQMDNSQVRFVSVEAVKMKGQYLMKVKNSYIGSLEIKDGRFVTSKGDKFHGLGIRNIEKVMESYGGLVKIEYDEKEFTLMTAAPEI